MNRMVAQLRTYFERANNDFLASADPSYTGSLRGAKYALGTGSDINVSLGAVFTKTVTGATTFSVTNAPAPDVALSFMLDLTNGGAFAVTWWSGVKWPGGTAPTLTASGRDVLRFLTHDGGATWVGEVVGLNLL
jgi:hypothetical protein